MIEFYQPAVTGFYIFLFIGVLLGGRKFRIALILLSIFTNGLSIDIGLGLSPSKITALASVILIIIGGVRLSSHRVWDMARRFAPFMAWVLVVWAIGYMLVPEMGGHSWARSSSGKPVVALFGSAIYLAYAVILFDGLRTYKDIQWFFNIWLIIALISAGLCFLQVIYHQVTGNMLWGIFRGSDLREFAGILIDGNLFQRANGLAEEPKQQALALMMSLVMLIALWGKNVINLPDWKYLFSGGFIAGAGFLTFSSGMYLVAGLFILYMAVISKDKKVKKISMAFIITLTIVVLFNQDFFKEVYDTRIERVVVKYDLWLSRDPADDKELPAMVYMANNPILGIAGVGLGSAPFYYEGLLPEVRFQGMYQEPNGGITWALYSFGIIGIALFAYAVKPFFMVRETKIIQIMLVGMLLYFIPLHPLSWLMMILGLSAAMIVRLRLTVYK